ncbi:MAG: hypothetical protein RMJ98_01260 [Myxococcales bacterium]|nr:hypothetical protein [Polyangiaceae bacterium]MDW8247915.1 hypothetical protein [Myxococcales bacterium]
MTQPPLDAPETHEPEEPPPNSDPLKHLLRRAAEMPVPPPRTDLLKGVQSRLRVRSRGKFYADAWSTREENPRSTYLITAALMLLLLLLVYWSLIPGGIGVTP